MLESLNYFNISLFLGGLVAIGSGAFVFFNDPHKRENIAWMLLNLVTAIWSFGYFSMLLSPSKLAAINSDWILHIGAILIPIFYFYFIVHLTKTAKKYQMLTVLFSVFAVAFLIISKSTLFVADVFPKAPLAFAPDAGPLYIYFTVYFFAIVLIAEWILLLTILKQKDLERTRLLYVLFSSSAGFIGGGSVFLLTFNINIPPYPLILFSLYPLIITYAILRHHLFNIKVISAELFTFAIWGLLFSRVLVSPTFEDQVITSGLLIATIISGIFLIRSVGKEIESREEIERLATDLSRANNRLQELDQLKSEFVSIASHQLRSPLTAIKGYASLILDGSFGKTPPAIHEAVDKMFQSCQSLVVMVEDFLNVSRIEQGRMKYEFETLDLEKVVKSVVDEQKPSAEHAHLSLTFSTDHLPPYFVKADLSKIRQVVLNLIDNAIKYTPKGSISVRLTKKRAERKIILAVADTGIGIDKETIPVLFSKFSRAKNANKVNVIGTGLGLYVVKEIVAGHKGEVWIESGGVGKGSTFFVELLEDSEAARTLTVTNFAKTV